jgi:hypothetical protein
LHLESSFAGVVGAQVGEVALRPGAESGSQANPGAGIDSGNPADSAAQADCGSRADSAPAADFEELRKFEGLVFPELKLKHTSH